MHACYSSIHKTEAELLNLWHWEQHASKGYLVRPCSNIHHLNPTLYVGMPVAPGSCSQDQEPRVQPSDFLLRLLCLLTPWPWKHKCVLDEGLVMEKLGQCVSTTLCRLFYIILHKDLTPRSYLFQMLTNPVTVTPTVLSEWRLGGSYLGGTGTQTE